MMNIKAISTNVGKALLVSALFMFLSMIVSVIYGRDDAFGPLLISFIITLIVGGFPFIFVRGRQPLSMKDDCPLMGVVIHIRNVAICPLWR